MSLQQKYKLHSSSSESHKETLALRREQQHLPLAHVLEQVQHIPSPKEGRRSRCQPIILKYAL
jgi:hypothetical protein